MSQLNVAVQIDSCLRELKRLETSSGDQAKFECRLQGFLSCLSDCLEAVGLEVQLEHNRPYRGKLRLCLSQILKSLALVASQPMNKQTLWCVCERVRWCLSELRRVLSGSVSESDRDSDGSDSFTHRIDCGLQLVRATDPASADLRHVVDDLVYQAVTIAKLASHMDYNEITSACHKVLEETKQLTEDAPVNPSHLGLLKDSLTAALTTLEQRVNCAVLRLLLQVFSEPHKPLKRLVQSCNRAPGARDSMDLGPLVAELDTHCERISLIGQYAVTACDDAKRSAEMKCCLASLEAVDNCLVPALTALYLSPGDTHLVHFLSDHWTDQLACLYCRLDTIIDSYALTRTVQDSMSELNERMRSEDTRETVRSLTKQGWLLYKHLARSADHQVDNNCLSRLKRALHECEAAINKPAALSTLLRRVKRVTIAVDCACEQLAAAINNTTTTTQATSQVSCTSNAKGVAGSPGAVDVQSLSDVPLDISVKSTSKTHFCSYRPQWLQNKISDTKMQKQLLNETKTNITSNTPRENKNICETPKNHEMAADMNLLTPYLSQAVGQAGGASTTLYARTPRRLVQARVMQDAEPDSTSGRHTPQQQHMSSLFLELSDILDNLSALGESFTSDNKSLFKREVETRTGSQLQATHSHCLSASSGDVQSFSMASVRTEEVSADVNTPERMQDLKDLEEKIKNLKLPSERIEQFV